VPRRIDRASILESVDQWFRLVRKRAWWHGKRCRAWIKKSGYLLPKGGAVMTDPNRKRLDQSLAMSAQVGALFGDILASSLARFVVEFLKHARESGLAFDNSGDQPVPKLNRGEAELEGAPAWVQEAFTALNQSGGETPMGIEEARTKVARNQIMVAMRKKGLTQAALAKKMGKSPTVISRILKNPERSRVTTLQSIATQLDVDLSEILPGKADSGRD
jgi:lambda repressor-like predicted transcriptional regulator